MGTSSSSFRAGARALLGVSLALAAGCSRGPELPDPVGSTLTPPVRRAAPRYVDTDPSALTDFAPVLADAGAFERDASLGLVWVPAPGTLPEGFLPYVHAGRWTRSGGEWIWQSDEPWGWVTFHYGRWTLARTRGWVWVPGRTYRGAWVDFRATSDGYVGWAPSPPDFLWGESGPLAVHGDAAPFVYVRAKDFASNELETKLVVAPEVLDVGARAEPRGDEPSPSALGLVEGAVPPSPRVDAGLLRAWVLAVPSTAEAAGVRPPLPAVPRLRTFVAGGPKYGAAPVP